MANDERTNSHNNAGRGHRDLPFSERYKKALADHQLGRNLLAFQRAWRPSRDAAFEGLAENPAKPPNKTTTARAPGVKRVGDPGDAEFQQLRDRLAAIKDEVIDNQSTYLDQFQREAEARGVHVYRAKDAAAVNRYVIDLCRKHGIQHVVKSKTMVSEETELNSALEAVGIRAVETDLGEWIQQLAHERPSHMVMPAIHKSREQVADLFTEATGRAVSREDIGEQVLVARRELRQDFLKAGLGISGANALIAETGTVMFISNEGNARLVSTLPSVHVVLAGIEKLLPDYSAAMTQLRLLARSATAQHITSYSSFLAGPPEPGKEMHIILVDNGRSTMRETPVIREALRCIRCAACADVCPPYAVVGGHVFGHIYSGAIGLVNTPFHHGIDAAAGPQSLCISCNACATVCPVAIPLPTQILNVRARVIAEKGMPFLMRLAFEIWSHRRLAGIALRAANVISGPVRRDGFTRIPGIVKGRSAAIRRLTDWRTPPALAPEPARALLPRRRPQQATLKSEAAGLRVAYFIQCITDRLFPEMASSTVRVLEACGVQVVVPEDQHCCGLPALDAGAPAFARRMAQQTIEMLEEIQADYIVTGGTSCAIAMLHDYESLFKDQPGWARRAAALADRVRDFTTFMSEIVKLEPGSLSKGQDAIGPVTYHAFCQSTNVMGVTDAPTRLLTEVLGLELRGLPEGTVCCGFGGSTSAMNPEVSEQILKRKLENVRETGAPVLVTDNPGCIMHLRGGADAQGQSLRVMHIAEVIAAHLPAD